jgi:hypothetical protein
MDRRHFFAALGSLAVGTPVALSAQVSERELIAGAYETFTARQAGVFDPVTKAQPLELRLKLAFEEGWKACRRQVLAAVGQ